MSIAEEIDEFLVEDYKRSQRMTDMGEPEKVYSYLSGCASKGAALRLKTVWS